MEAYSEDIFNRIIAFLVRQHPAWISELTFTQRIEGLPLHFLVFSAPDRDPAMFGPTVAPFIPLRAEMRKLAAYARQVADQPVICDLHAGNGFVGSLLAREGVKVIGVRDPAAKPNQIRRLYDSERYEFRDVAIEAID